MSQVAGTPGKKRAIRWIATPLRKKQPSFGENHDHAGERTAESRDAVQRAREFCSTERAILHSLPLPDPENQRTRLAFGSRGQSGATTRGGHRRVTANGHGDECDHSAGRG